MPANDCTEPTAPLGTPGLTVVEVVCIAAIRGRGHPNVQAMHEATLELLVGEDRLTPRGDCIVCVEGRVEGDDCSTCIGAPAMLLLFAATPDGDMAAAKVYGICGEGGKPVVRRSAVCREAIMCRAGASARDLPRRLAELLSSGFTLCTALFASPGRRRDV